MQLKKKVGVFCTFWRESLRCSNFKTELKLKNLQDYLHEGEVAQLAQWPDDRDIEFRFPADARYETFILFRISTPDLGLKQPNIQ
jgi:hypothetical protein